MTDLSCSIGAMPPAATRGANIGNIFLGCFSGSSWSCARTLRWREPVLALTVMGHRTSGCQRFGAHVGSFLLA